MTDYRELFTPWVDPVERIRELRDSPARDYHRTKVLDIVAPSWRDREVMSDSDVLKVAESAMFSFVSDMIHEMAHVRKQMNIHREWLESLRETVGKVDK